MRLTEQVAGGGGWFRRSHAPSQGSQGRRAGDPWLSGRWKEWRREEGGGSFQQDQVSGVLEQAAFSTLAHLASASASASGKRHLR